jgi:hypothetical protein
MKYRVTSGRMSWPDGTVISAEDLAGCNIEVLVATGHLARVADGRRQPEPPVSDDSADEPEEQE